jgi:hypothetical protein
VKRPPQSRVRLPESILAFVAGVTEPSWGALAIGGVFFGLVALWTAQHLEKFVAGYPEILAASASDDYAFVTAATMGIAATKVDVRGVAIVGASCLRPATDEAMIEHDLQKVNSRERVFNLTTAGQSLWESIAIADYIVPSFGGVVIIDTNPLRFSRGHDFLLEALRVPRLGFRSAILEELARDAKIPATIATGIYAWDFRAYYGKRLGNVFPNLINGPVTHDHTRLTENATQKQLDRMAKGITREIEGYDAGVEVLLDAVSHLASRLAKENSTRIILIEPPINPHFVDTVIGRDFYTRHLARLRQFAQQQNIQFWELHTKTSLVESNFADWCHLNNAQARKAYSQLFSAYLVNDLHDSKL